MKFHQKVVRDETQWAHLSELKTDFEAEAKKAEDERQDAQRSRALLAGLKDALETSAQGQKSKARVLLSIH